MRRMRNLSSYELLQKECKVNYKIEKNLVRFEGLHRAGGNTETVFLITGDRTFEYPYYTFRHECSEEFKNMFRKNVEEYIKQESSKPLCWNIANYRFSSKVQSDEMNYTVYLIPSGGVKYKGESHLKGYLRLLNFKSKDSFEFTYRRGGLKNPGVSVKNPTYELNKYLNKCDVNTDIDEMKKNLTNILDKFFDNIKERSLKMKYDLKKEQIDTIDKDYEFAVKKKTYHGEERYIHICWQPIGTTVGERIKSKLYKSTELYVEDMNNVHYIEKAVKDYLKDKTFNDFNNNDYKLIVDIRNHLHSKGLMK